MRYLLRFYRIPVLFFTTILVISCSMPVGDEREPYAKKLDEAFEAWAKFDNELMDFYQPSFIDNYSLATRELSGLSREAISNSFEGAKEGMTIVQSIDTTKLSELERLDVAAARLFFETLVEGQKYAYHECLINPIDGLHFSLFEDLAFGFQMNAKNDGDYYLAKVRTYPEKIDQLKSYLNECADKGSLPPKALLEEVSLQVKKLAETPPRQHPIYKGIARQLGNADPVMINELEATDYLITAASTIEEFIVPPYRELLAMIDVLIKNAEDEISVDRFADGNAFYQHQLKKYLGRSVKVEGLHKWGIGQFDSLAAIYDLNDLRKEEQLMPASKRIRVQIASLDSARAYLQRMKRNAGGLMGNVPQSKIYVVEMPDWALDYTPTWKYYPGSLSGHRRGILLVDMTHAEYQGVLTHRIQLYQNGIPGLHLIKSANIEQKGFSELLKFLRFDGNSEAWRLYSGDLVVETLGLLNEEKSAYAEYGQEKLLGLAKLIVDTGINSEGWTRMQAMEFLRKKIYLSKREAKRLTDECIIYPGKGCAPWLGYMDLLDLQEDVQRIEGDEYYLQAFHDLIMRISHSPFNLARSRLPLLLN